MFSTGVFFKIWNVNKKDYYTEVDCSTSKKNKDGNYETDFSSKFVRFVGNAHKKNPQPNEKIKVTSCGVQNVFERDGKKEYLKSPSYVVFDFEREGATPSDGYMPSGYSGTPSGFEEIPLNDSLPF